MVGAASYVEKIPRKIGSTSGHRRVVARLHTVTRKLVAHESAHPAQRARLKPSMAVVRLISAASPLLPPPSCQTADFESAALVRRQRAVTSVSQFAVPAHLQSRTGLARSSASGFP